MLEFIMHKYLYKREGLYFPNFNLIKMNIIEK